MHHSSKKNKHTDGFWWKRFFYTVTGAKGDYELGPNWFASIMGTGIIANASATLPYFSDKLYGFAVMVWTLASFMLVSLTISSLALLARTPSLMKKHFGDPMMAQFFGAPPMALLTIAGGTLLLGETYFSPTTNLAIAWILWSIGTIAGLGTAVIIPYRLFTVFSVREDSAFGGWLMPVVPPMVSAAIGAMLVPHAAEGVAREMMFYFCFILFGLSLVAAFIIISMIWSRLAHHGTSGTSRVPTLWIVLGPLGQSMTAAGILGTVATGAVPEKIAFGFELLPVLYGVPVLGFVLLWSCIATLLTLRARRRQMKFALTYWAFTFPVGTCVTGIAQLAHHTGLAAFSWLSIFYFIALLMAWSVAAFGTTKGMITGYLFKPPPAFGAPIISVKEPRVTTTKVE